MGWSGWKLPQKDGQEEIFTEIIVSYKTRKDAPYYITCVFQTFNILIKMYAQPENNDLSALDRILDSKILNLKEKNDGSVMSLKFEMDNGKEAILYSVTPNFADIDFIQKENPAKIMPKNEESTPLDMALKRIDALETRLDRLERSNQI